MADKLSLVASKSGELDENSPYFIPDTFQGKVDPNYFCRGWNSKRNKYCRAEAGRGTDHKGVGRCRNHGGSTPIKSGRYSDVPRGAVKELMDEFDLETDEEKMNIMPEATLIRAITGNIVEQYEDFLTGILRFNELEEEEAKEEKRKPMYLRAPSLKDVIECAERGAEVVNKIHKQRAANAISLKDFIRVQTLQATIVREELELLEQKLRLSSTQCEILEETKARISDKWTKIKVA